MREMYFSKLANVKLLPMKLVSGAIHRKPEKVKNFYAGDVFFETCKCEAFANENRQRYNT